ncbi:HD domain-containing phosphohydrolase [Bacillus sp. 03113]|uniref:HD domain-containing phosphohydrolase n=1 Tax=Bacillus sp. 03113 TaxID=2578211 RepID=UPI001144D5E3|nr:HD domain-containing phosphohydrolase [Bacillus sp. 03113]
MGIIDEGTYIETVHINGLQISLVASGDGTEVIHHKMQRGSHWALRPEEGWSALEYLYILSGELELQTSECPKVLRAGDSFYGHPIQEHYVFHCHTETEFLYVSSQPVFHYYSKITKEKMDLAIAIEEKDGYTVDHCKRIKEISMKIGKALGLKPKQIILLNIASFLHDIGKVKVPLSILQKPGKLTYEEWEIMKLHTTYGREILEESGHSTLIEVGKIVEQHHERFDGNGYPKGLKGDEISIEAAIISVADSYDAMTTDRVYQKGRTKEEALEEILKNRGTMYHPDIVDIFLALDK